jgi:hypothetical protein
MINELKCSQSTSQPQTEGEDEMDRICRKHGADEKLIMRKYLDDNIKMVLKEIVLRVCFVFRVETIVGHF